MFFTNWGIAEHHESDRERSLNSKGRKVRLGRLAGRPADGKAYAMPSRAPARPTDQIIIATKIQARPSTR